MSIEQQAQGQPYSRLRLETLVRLRWLAVAGQTAAVLYVAFVLGYPLPLLSCLALIGASAAFNLGLLARYPTTHRLRSGTAAGQLAYDCVQLAGLLFLTGGLENPFCILFLAPVSVSATTLPSNLTWWLSALVVALATLLAIFHLPLPWDPDGMLSVAPLYIIGIWTGLTLGVAFISFYTNRVAHESRQLAAALTATEVALTREQHLSTLDGLAAAAAHELGTPLATIALAAREMQSEGAPANLKADIDLIAEQVTRCRTILARLRNLDPSEPTLFSTSTLSLLVAEVADPHRDFGVEIAIEFGSVEGPEPTIRRHAGLIYGLGNIIENAVDYAQKNVSIILGWNAREISIEVVDDGKGFPPELVARLGEPYLTTRRRPPGPTDPAEPGGLGLGIFIAKTLLGRSGGDIRFSNAPKGAKVSMTWPRAQLEPAPSASNFDAPRMGE